ncbi:hypothetical protein AB1N83_005427 [Pleurotus pulmonarius]
MLVSSEVLKALGAPERLSNCDCNGHNPFKLPPPNSNALALWPNLLLL